MHLSVLDCKESISQRGMQLSALRGTYRGKTRLSTLTGRKTEECEAIQRMVRSEAADGDEKRVNFILLSLMQRILPRTPTITIRQIC
jgi:hypothetical protein